MAMRLSITGRHTSVTDAMKNYATEKMSRLERHDDLVTAGEIVMNIEKGRHMVEMTAHTKIGDRVFGKAEHTDMYAAIDLLLDKMDRQLTKQKELVKGAKKHSGRHKSGAAAGSGKAGRPTLVEEKETGEGDDEDEG